MRSKISPLFKQRVLVHSKQIAYMRNIFESVVLYLQLRTSMLRYYCIVPHFWLLLHIKCVFIFNVSLFLVLDIFIIAHIWAFIVSCACLLEFKIVMSFFLLESFNAFCLTMLVVLTRCCPHETTFCLDSLCPTFPCFPRVSTKLWRQL